MVQQPPGPPRDTPDDEEWGSFAQAGQRANNHDRPGPPDPPPRPNIFSSIPPRAWGRTFLIPLVFFAGALVMAGISAGLLSTATTPLDGVGVPSAITGGADTGASWIVLTFQLLGMAFLSPLALGVDVNVADVAEFGFGGSLFFVPWIVLAGGIGTVAATQRFLGGNMRTSRTAARLVLAGAAGIAFATVMMILVAAIRFRISDVDISQVGGSLWAHSASFTGFLVSALLIGCITYLLLLPHRSQFLRRLLSGVSTASEHVVSLAVVGILAVLISALVDGEFSAVLAAFVALPTVGFFGASAMHFIPVVLSGDQSTGLASGMESFTLFELPVWAWICALAVMLVALIVISLRWSLRTRFKAHAAWAWVVLPLVYLGTGILMTFGNGLYVTMFESSDAFSGSIRSASWGFLVWVLIAGVIQLLAIFVMPQLIHRLPGGLLRILAARLALPPALAPASARKQQGPPPAPPAQTTQPSAAAAQSAQAEAPGEPERPHGVEETTTMDPVPPLSADYEQGNTAQAPPPPEWGAAPAARREPQGTSKKTKVLLFSGVGVVLVVAAAWAAHAILARTVYGPQHTAEAYLEAVVDGRAEEALDSLGPNVTDEQRALATDEIYQAAEDRPDSFEVGDVEHDGSTAVVEAELVQSGKTYPMELSLEASGRQDMVFNDWSLEDGDVAGRASYTSGPSELTVNGVESDIEPSGEQPEAEALDDAASDTDDAESVEEEARDTGQVLLPGTYTFTAPEGSEYLSHGDDLELTITPGEVSAEPIEFSQQYTSSFEQDAVEQIEQRLESCVASTVIRIEDCEAASWEDTAWNAMTDIERTWEQTPDITLVPAESDGEFGSDDSLEDYSGPVTAQVDDGRINISYKVRDDADDDWSNDRDRTYNPFQAGGIGPMEFPVTVDGDEISIDYSALDEPNPQWLSPEQR